MDNNLISFIIPTLNSEDTIINCLSSIYNQELPESWKSEIIIVDNGSNDNTVKLVEGSFPIKVLHETVLGPGNARNKGLSQAEGTLIAFVDSDVVLSKNWAKTSINKMLSGNYAGGQGYTEPYGSGWLKGLRDSIAKNTTFNKNNHLYNIGDSFLTPAINTSACIYKKNWISAVNGFSPNLKRQEDRDLSTRIFLKGGVLCDTKAEAKVVFSNGIFRYFLRSFLNGINLFHSIMGKLPVLKIENFPKTNCDKYVLSRALLKALFITGYYYSRGIHAQKSKIKIPKARLLQAYLSNKLGFSVSPYLRIIELDQDLVVINLKSQKAHFMERVDFNKTDFSSLSWIYEDKLEKKE